MTEPQFSDYQTKSVAEFMLKAKQATPLFPTIPSLEVRKLRARLILEEAMETVHALGFSIDAGDSIIDLRIGDVVLFHKWPPDIQLIADGCADLKVVTVGTELACGINGKPVFDEVMDSNMSKFIDGHTREDGKWVKGPSYRPANIERVLREQGWKP